MAGSGHVVNLKHLKEAQKWTEVGWHTAQTPTPTTHFHNSKIYEIKISNRCLAVSSHYFIRNNIFCASRIWCRHRHTTSIMSLKRCYVIQVMVCRTAPVYVQLVNRCGESSSGEKNVTLIGINLPIPFILIKHIRIYSTEDAKQKWTMTHRSEILYIFIRVVSCERGNAHTQHLHMTPFCIAFTIHIFSSCILLFLFLLYCLGEFVSSSFVFFAWTNFSIFRSSYVKWVLVSRCVCVRAQNRITCECISFKCRNTRHNTWSEWTIIVTVNCLDATDDRRCPSVASVFTWISIQI